MPQGGKTTIICIVYIYAFFRGKFKHIYWLKLKDVMSEAFLSLGGNLGDRWTVLDDARQVINSQAGEIIKASSVYETEAWGSSSKKKYLNQVLKIKTRHSAEQLLKLLQGIENKAGRQRQYDRNADRVLDIDLLFFNDSIINRKSLQVPHPRLHQRNFVLTPLNEIESGLVHPVLKKNVAALLKQSPDNLDVKRYHKPIDRLFICIEGNIGSGKTTLAKALSKKWKARFLPEVFDENHLLPLFYKDPGLFSFAMEFGFLISRFQQITDLGPGEKQIVVGDYSIYKSLWFARVNLPPNEFRIFEKQFNTLEAMLPKPDLIVYLDTSTKNAGKNIKTRGRPYERHIKSDYLKKIEASYKKGLPALSAHKQLVIPVRDYHKGLEKELITVIENYIKENFGGIGKKSIFSLLK